MTESSTPRTDAALADAPGIDGNSRIANFMRDLERELAEQKRALSDGMPKWISCGETPAPERRPVWVYFLNSLGNGRTTRARWVPRWSEPYEGDEDPEFCSCEQDAKGDWFVCTGWWEDPVEGEGSYRISDEVTHWMPLPEAPK